MSGSCSNGNYGVGCLAEQLEARTVLPIRKVFPTLILTATIDPKGIVALKLRDVKTRRQQYLQALRAWLAMPGDELEQIVFVENSGSDLNEFNQLASSENQHQRAV